MKNSKKTLQTTKVKESLGTKATSLADLVTKQILEYIIIGEFVPGQRLKEEELCRMFDISRPPIREAFKTLQAKGILEYKPRKGVFIAQFTDQDVFEVYTINTMLYQKATDLALDIITDEEIAELKRYLDKMIMAAESEPCDVREYQIAHGDFHQFVIEVSGYRRIKELDRQLRDQTFIFSYKSLKERSHLENSLRYHREIFKAISDRNKEKALQLTEEHISNAISFLKGKLPVKRNDGPIESDTAG